MYKQLAHEIKELDEAKGIVGAYANVYLNVDSDGDISAKGAFTKTVSENFKRIRVLKDHIPTISLGVPMDIDAKNDYGLWTLTQFNMKKEVSRDMFTDIKLAHEHNQQAELSIGFSHVKRDSADKRIITEYGKLWEYSFLSSWAANELATVTDLKGMKKGETDRIMKFLTDMYNLPYSDARLRQVENILKSLDEEPSEEAVTPPVEPTKDEQIKSFLDYLI